MCLLIIAVLAIPGLAMADGEAIGGALFLATEDGRDPVQGVTITVSQDGTAVGEATSDPDGAWNVAVPAAGTYSVELDTSSS